MLLDSSASLNAANTGEVEPVNGKAGAQLAEQLYAEDEARSQTYAILAALLNDIPSSDVVDYLRHIQPLSGDQSTVDTAPSDPGEVGLAWQDLRQRAIESTAEGLDDEFHALFIGIGRGEVVPYGSFHITGFLMDKPLGELRADMALLGLESKADNKEPEDHIAALCECMSILITSDDVESFQQRRFYIRHIHPFAEKFFNQLKNAKSADFYQAVAGLGLQFTEFENQYLNILEH